MMSPRGFTVCCVLVYLTSGGRRWCSCVQLCCYWKRNTPEQSGNSGGCVWFVCLSLHVNEYMYGYIAWFALMAVYCPHTGSLLLFLLNVGIMRSFTLRGPRRHRGSTATSSLVRGMLGVHIMAFLATQYSTVYSGYPRY